MPDRPSVAQQDRDLDDGVRDLPAEDRNGLRALDTKGSERPTPGSPEPKAKTPTERTRPKSARPKSPRPKGPRKAQAKRQRKTKTKAQAKRTTPKAKPVLYTSDTPKGLWSVGTQVKYLGGPRVRNNWLKKGAVGRVFGYRPGKKGGGLYAVRFEGGATLLSVKRVSRVGN